jgi:hypothetical protein
MNNYYEPTSGAPGKNGRTKNIMDEWANGGNVAITNYASQ